MNKEEINRLNEMMKYENEAYAFTYTCICGIDEAGRGPLCGPVVAGAVILKKDTYIEGLNDSKKLSEKKRKKIYDEIVKNAISYAVGTIYEDEIDKINILEATRKAMKIAVSKLKVTPDFALVDAEKHVPIDIPYISIIKGDSLSVSIAAASIIAKVTRDNMMEEYDKEYPEYNFSKHKGYGTKAHIDAIKKYGLCKIHRKSFCKKFI